ncbi:hypothetical protein [Solihabitans fulvus]|nr:hypothetical protein [Solihabitans fulvus]
MTVRRHGDAVRGRVVGEAAEPCDAGRPGCQEGPMVVLARSVRNPAVA